MLNHYFVFEFPFNNVGRLFILFDIFDFTYIVISILEIYAKNFCKIRYLWQEFPIGCVACHLSNGRISDIWFPIKTRAKLKYPVGGEIKMFPNRSIYWLWGGRDVLSESERITFNGWREQVYISVFAKTFHHS